MPGAHARQIFFVCMSAHVLTCISYPYNIFGASQFVRSLVFFGLRHANSTEITFDSMGTIRTKPERFFRAHNNSAGPLNGRRGCAGVGIIIIAETQIPRERETECMLCVRECVDFVLWKLCYYKYMRIVWRWRQSTPEANKRTRHGKTKRVTIYTSIYNLYQKYFVYGYHRAIHRVFTHTYIYISLSISGPKHYTISPTFIVGVRFWRFEARMWHI